MLLAALALLLVGRLFEAGAGGSDTGNFGEFGSDNGWIDPTWDQVWDDVATVNDPARSVDSARREQMGKDPLGPQKAWADSLLDTPYDPLTDPASSVSAAIRERLAGSKPDPPYSDIYGNDAPPIPWDQLDEYLTLYAETKDPAVRAQLEALLYTYPDPAYFDTEADYWQAWADVNDVISFLNDVDAGLYDPLAYPDDYGEYWYGDPWPGGGGRQYGDKFGGGGGGGGRGSGGPGSYGPNTAARVYQRAASFRRNYGSSYNSGFLRRRRKRSQVLRGYRLKKSGWIDPFPWIPGTGPEKELFEWLVRRRIYFIFQGQVPELEPGGKYAGSAVPDYEPDFILPQYRVILDPFSPFHHSLPSAQIRDIEKIALYEAIGYRYYHPWALAPGLWSFDQDGVNHGRFSTAELLNQMPELGHVPLPLSDAEKPYVGQGYRLGQNLGAGATSVGAANRARVKARNLNIVRRLSTGANIRGA